MKFLAALWSASVALVPVFLTRFFPSGGDNPHLQRHGSNAATTSKTDYADAMSAVSTKLKDMTMVAYIAEPMNSLDEVAIVSALDLFIRQGFQGKAKINGLGMDIFTGNI
jgi:hypothetical protein